MARVTVEDCIDQLPNRFELVMLATQRARQISSGASLHVPRDNDKNPVVALREMAGKHLSLEDLKEGLIRSYQRVPQLQDDEEDEPALDLMEGEAEGDEDMQARAGTDGDDADADEQASSLGAMAGLEADSAADEADQ